MQSLVRVRQLVPRTDSLGVCYNHNSQRACEHFEFLLAETTQRTGHPCAAAPQRARRTLPRRRLRRRRRRRGRGLRDCTDSRLHVETGGLPPLRARGDGGGGGVSGRTQRGRQSESGAVADMAVRRLPAGVLLLEGMPEGCVAGAQAGVQGRAGESGGADEGSGHLEGAYLSTWEQLVWSSLHTSEPRSKQVRRGGGGR
jgi:hypothetical protein